MKVFSDDKNINLVQPVASASTLISSLASQAKDYVLSKFPKDFFQHVYIETSETTIQENYNDNYNKKLNKIPYPSCSIMPEISLDDPIGDMRKSLNISSPNLFLRKDVKRTYKKLLIDPDDRIGIYYTSDYITSNFRFTLTTKSFIQNTDLVYYVKSAFQDGMFRYLNGAYLETEIPKTFIKILALAKNLDLENSDDMDTLRLLLIGSGKQKENILKKTSLTTGKVCFFLNETENILLLLSDIDAPPSIIRDNKVEGEYTVSFRVQVSAWLPNAFIMSIDQKIFDKAKDLPTGDDEQNVGIYTFSSKPLTKKMTCSFKDLSGEEHIGALITSNIVTAKMNDDVGTIELIDELPPELRNLHAYLTSKMAPYQIDLSQLFYIRVVDSEGDLDNVVVDLENFSISFSDRVTKDFAYAIYLNRVIYETLIKDMEKNKFFSKDILTYVDLTIGEDEMKFPIKAGNESPLRIQTPYGVGSFILTDDSNNDSFKVSSGNQIFSVSKLDTVNVRFSINGYETKKIVIPRDSTLSVLPTVTEPGFKYWGIKNNNKTIKLQKVHKFAEDTEIFAVFE